MAASQATATVKGPFDVNLDCIHCGLCLPKCPTYRVLGNEADSPRGRIYLMRAVREKGLALDQKVVQHLEACLACRACETACPSGVRFERMLTEARERIYREHPPPLPVRLLLRQILPRPVLTKAMFQWLSICRKARLLPLLRRLAPLHSSLARLLEAERRVPPLRRAPSVREEYPAARGEGERTVAFFWGCVAPFLYPSAQQACLQVLRHSGFRVWIPRRQTCCGALQAHCGDLETARRLARINVEAFSQRRVEAIVVNAAGCGALLKDYAHLLGEAADGRVGEFVSKVRDISEFLAETAPFPQLAPLPERVAYDDPCHLLHAQGIASQPRAQLRKIPQLELVSPADSDRSCGSAGLYNLLQPALADRILEEKVEQILKISPQRIVTGNPGCMMQLQYGLRRRGLDIPVQHPVELIWETLRGPSPSSEGPPRT